MVYTPFIWPLVFAILINGGLAIYARRFRGLPAALSLSLLMVLGSLTALIYALEISAASLPVKIFWSQLRFIPLAPVAPTLFVFVLEYLGLGNRLTRSWLALIYLIPVITILLSLSGATHHLFRYDFHLDQTGAIPVLLFSRGAWWFIYFFYSIGLHFLSLGLLFGSSRVRALSYRITLVIALGLLFTIVIDILYTMRLTPFPGYYWTPSLFTLTGALFAWALLRGRLLDVAPVARAAVIENMEDLVIVLDTQDHIVDFNPAAQAACRLSLGSIGATLEQALPPEWAGLTLRFGDEPIVPLNSNVKHEVTVAGASGGSGPGQHVYELTLSPVQDKRRRNIGRLFLLHDITRRKQTEQALRASEERFRQLFDHAPIAVAVFLQGKIVMVNPAAIRLVGAASPGELVGKPFLDFVYPDFRQPVAERARSLLSGVGVVPSFEEKLLCLDGSAIDVEVTSAAITYGDQPAIQSMIIDISERKRAVDALKISETRYRSLFEHMLDGFAYCQMLYQDQKPVDFVYLEVNRAFETLTGLKDVQGRKVSEVIPGIQETNPELFELYGRVALTGVSERFETHITVLDLWLSISVYGTEKEYFVAVFENITQRKLAAEQIEKALDEKEVLLKEIHHRVKNNLTVISSLLELQARISQDERVQSAFQNSQSRIQAMSAIHEQLYRSNNLSHIDMDPYITGLAGEVSELYAVPNIGIRIEVKAVQLVIDQAIPCGLIINELLTNAFKYAFTAVAGEQAVGSEPNARQVAVSMQRDHEHCVLLVSDNGCGLPDEFDVQTAKSLGLKLVNRLAGQLNGDLEVTSAPGRGTAYKITFPVQV